MRNDSADKLWEDYLKTNPDTPKKYEAWAFGDSKEMADELAKLVLEGTKTATASNYVLYKLDDEPLPHVGLHNIILDGEGKAVAIVETTSVEVVPFDEVTPEFAFLEGEGDRTLKYWRDVHKTFFTKEFKNIRQEFQENMLVVCEKFSLIFKK
ncbi:RNA-binding protein [Salipaludibacillus neizhouensis]|uniref:RNA-binding protein n=1 Tax=Salipaludibacillus neizhouensis TaxID=885475 RepID=A0A3A9K412_9BACI|nr:ASCH domain-containing protein [Salipaludibacillus neizhouensis]RKL67367.1 RNA-binding protein [Salipaludibacillus neizhouensis]